MAFIGSCKWNARWKYVLYIMIKIENWFQKDREPYITCILWWMTLERFQEPLLEPINIWRIMYSFPHSNIMKIHMPFQWVKFAFAYSKYPFTQRDSFPPKFVEFNDNQISNSETFIYIYLFGNVLIDKRKRVYKLWQIANGRNINFLLWMRCLGCLATLHIHCTVLNQIEHRDLVFAPANF